MDIVWLDFDAVSASVTSAGDRVLAGDAESRMGSAAGENLVAAVWQVAARAPNTYRHIVAWAPGQLRLDSRGWCHGWHLSVGPAGLSSRNAGSDCAGKFAGVPGRFLWRVVSRWRRDSHSAQSGARSLARHLPIVRPVVVLSRRTEAPSEILRTTDQTITLQLHRDKELTEGQGTSAIVRRGGVDLAMILFTSGSTGAPKGVMLSHRNLLSNARSILRYLPIRDDDRSLVVLPFYHAFGNSILQTHLLAGATLILEGSLAIPATVLQTLREKQASSFSGVPEVYAMLMRFAPWQPGELPHLRYMAVAGGEMRPELADQVSERIAPAELYVMYGQTEGTARLAYLPPKLRRTHRGSIGKAIPGVELRVVNERGTRVAADEIGMLEARGDNIMLGYWQDPQGTAAVLRDGWLSSGDLATVDEKDFIYLRGRANRLVKLQSNRVHPAEIEDMVARQFPGTQAAVVPFEVDERTRLALFCTPPRGAALTDRDLHQLCVRELPYYKVPQYIEVLDCLPLNSGLKVDREELARRVRSQGRAKETELCHP